ncbi:MAG: LamG-like jellyroll fold domain-containing protein, partial [Bacteroidota bacterium]
DYYQGTIDFNDGDYFTFAQEPPPAPGGVSLDLQVWLRADSGAVVDASQNITAWIDQSGSNHSPTTVVSDPLVVANGVNYNPSVEFDGNDWLHYSGATFTSTFTAAEAITVTLDDNYAGGNGHPYDFGGSGRDFHYTWSNGSVYQGSFTNQRLGFNPLTDVIVGNKTGVDSISGPPIDVRKWNIYGTHSATNDWGLQFNGAYKAVSSVNTVNFNVSSYERIGDAGRRFTGKLPEVILYNRVLTTTERSKVNSYLAIKYGIALDTAAANYLAANGTVIWTHGTGYDTDIAGIGYDKRSGLIQKQSKSVSGDLITIGIGAIDTTNSANTGTFAANNSFLVWGHNGELLDFANPLANDHNYASRLWKVQETGTIDSVAISIHIDQIRGTELLLVRSTDTTIDASDDQISLTLDGDYYKGKIDFSNGDYFTLAQIPPPAPGGVSFGLEVWTLPASITYDTANNNLITRVEDYSGKIAADQTYGLFDAISSDPRIVEGGINFNDNIEFDGNDWFRKTGGFNTNTWTAGERFVVLAENQTGYNGNNGFPTDFAAITGATYYTHSNKGIYHRFGSVGRHTWLSTTGADLESDGTHQGYLFDSRNYLIDNVWSETDDWGSDVNANPTFRDTTNTPAFTMTQFHWGAVSNVVYNGHSPELFFYSRKLTDHERLKVNTYLGIKYGISLGTDTTLVNYLDSKGNTIWTGTAGYQNNVAGIGQDDGSGLLQKQSTTINSDKSVVMYLGDHTGTGLPATNKLNTQTFPNNRDFMVWGDNNESLGFIDPYTPNSFTPDGPYFTMQRVWLLQEKTGNIGTVSVKAPKGATYLLVHNSPDFSTGTPTEIALTIDAFGNAIATYDFNDGDYFTFAQEPPPSPGGVSFELGTWLKADSDVFADLGTTNAVNNNPVQQWNTQINEDHATQTAASQQPIFKNGEQPEAINFNPAIFFDGNNDELKFPSKLGVTGTNNFTIFAAGKASSAGAKRIFGPSNSASNAYEMDINGANAVQAGVTVIAASSKTTAINESFIAYTAREGNTFSAATNGEVPITGTNTKNFTSTNNYDLGSSYNQNPDFHGLFGEFVVYEGAKTSDDIQKIQSYLAIKYGATLDTNYVASDGTTIWTEDTTYNQAIAGIGYDKAAGLLQKQSWSTVDTTIAIGLGNVFQSNQLNPTTFPNNLSFLIWGSDGGTTTIDTVITPLMSRMKRVWKTSNVQSIGDVVARVHGASLGITDETPIVLVSTDETIDENDTIYELSENNGYYKGTINLPDGVYFSIGLKAPQPLIIPIKYSKN